MSKQISNPTPAVPAVFNFESHEVRAIERNGEIWIVAKDVAEILGYKNPREAVRMYCKHAKPLGGENLYSPLSIDPQAMIIPRGDVFRLVSRSKLPTAERFETWLMDEVVPQIFDHGHYSVAPQNNNLPAIPKDPLELFLMTAEAIKQLSNRTIQIESQLTQMEDVALEAVAKSEQAVTTVDDFLATRPLTHTQCYEVRLAVEKKKQLLTDKYSIPSGGTVYAGLYSFLKHHFRVNTYTGIPSARYDEALMIINNITLDQLPENVRKAVPKAKAKKGGAK